MFMGYVVHYHRPDRVTQLADPGLQRFANWVERGWHTGSKPDGLERLGEDSAWTLLLC